MGSRVRLNSPGIAAALKAAPMQAAIRSTAESVAAKVRAQGHTVGGDDEEIDLPVEVGMTITDRAHGSVTLAHPAGAAVQAKHGALTKAAGQAGLDVRGSK